MENPWVDSWKETVKPVEESDLNQEADLATPSWSTGAGIPWTEPSDFSLWNNNNVNPIPSWIPPKSPYDDILIVGRTPSQPDFDISGSPVGGSQTPPDTPASPKHDSLAPTSLSQSPEPQAISPIPSHSSSPDAFGTFESAGTDINDVNSWAASAKSLPSAALEGNNAWGAGWVTPSEAQSSDEQPPLDEWEKAKLQKKKQDQHVPPDLLASILEHAKALSNDLWPDSMLNEGETRQPSQDFLTNAPSLIPAVEMFVPEDLVLTAHVPFVKTFAVKRMNEALRLTKHLPMTSSSPISIYMASKGSTEWEASVKSKQDNDRDDVLPPGWRMVEKNKETSSTPEVKKRAGGLLSFLGIKNSEGPTEPTSQNLTLSRPTSIISNAKSPSSSLDLSSEPASESRSSIGQPITMSSTSNSDPSFPPPASDQKMSQGAASQSSAVSRFFGRFTRSSAAPLQSSAPQSHSIALSSDDIDFLSDVVPSANDDGDEDENRMSLTLATSPSSIPRPLPQRLPPPPKSSLPPPPLSSVLSTRTASAKGSTKPADLFSLFDHPAAEQSLTTTESYSIEQLVPVKSTAGQTLSAPNLPPKLSSPTVPMLTTVMTQTSRAHFVTAPFANLPAPHGRNMMAIMLDSDHATTTNLRAPPPPAPLPPPTAFPDAVAHSSRLSPSQLPPQQQASFIGEEDEFSEFMSSPAGTDFSSKPFSNMQTINSPTTKATDDTPKSFQDHVGITSNFPSPLSNQNLLHSSSFGFDVDDFASFRSGHSGLEPSDDDFTKFVSPPSSTLPASAPPCPPSKPSTLVLPAQLSKALIPKDLSVLKEGRGQSPPPTTSTKPDHPRTADPVESAASRPGRWPAPASPSRRIVALPPSTGKNSLDILNDVASPPQRSPHSPTATFHKKILDIPVRVMSPPLTPSKTNEYRTTSPTPLSFGAMCSKPSTAPATNADTSQRTGGLSAQDISFFEGL